jgi:Skp family chaperone for outer membrane proteins
VSITHEIIMQVVTFLMGGVIAKLLDSALGKKKSDAETDVIVSDNWKVYAEKMESQFEKVRQDYEALGAKYFSLLNEYQEFKMQILKNQSHNNIYHESNKNS